MLPRRAGLGGRGRTSNGGRDRLLIADHAAGVRLAGRLGGGWRGRGEPGERPVDRAALGRGRCGGVRRRRRGG